jgi:hypothetical protein
LLNRTYDAPQYDEEDEAALADLVSKKGQQAADDAVNNVGEAKVSADHTGLATTISRDRTN